MTKSEYLTEYDGIVKTMQMYIDGSKQGKSELMRPAFHPDASFFGYAGEQLAIGTPFLFDWIDIHLHGLDDSVIFSEVFALGHAGDSRIGECWASTAKRGQSRSASSQRVQSPGFAPTEKFQHRE
jgi:hypothetical protein